MYKSSRRGRPPLKAALPQSPPMTTFSIGNCRVEFPASYVFSTDSDGLQINVTDSGTVRIKVSDEAPMMSQGFSFTLLNPKALDGAGDWLLQEVLKLYYQELPAMSYAANTGKESRFLEDCIMTGKYCTLILRNAQLELIGAVTYQILPTDAHQAELPLAAVKQTYHRQGYGSYLYKELQRRLVYVGVSSIFCWGDQESEPFWAKQGFVIVAEVDGRGKPRNLPIRADVRKAMSIPGSATLMISYFTFPSIQSASPPPPADILVAPPETAEQVCRKTSTETPPSKLQSARQMGEKAGKSLSPSLTITTPQVVGESKSSQAHTITPVHVDGGSPKNCGSITPLNMEGILSSVASQAPTTNSVEPIATTVVPTTKPPLANITNKGTGATRPPKKRPYNRANSTVKSVTTAANGIEDTVRGKSTKEDDEKSPCELEKSLSGGMSQAGPRHTNELKIPASGGHEAEVNKKFLVNSSGPKGKKGVKRGRDSETQILVFGRRSARRRKVDPSVNRTESADVTEDHTNEEIGKSMSENAEIALAVMVDLLLPKHPGQRIVENAQECAASDRQDHAEVQAGPSSCTNLVNPRVDTADGVDTCKFGAGVTSSSTDKLMHQRRLPPGTVDADKQRQLSNKKGPIIMFMNMANESQKKQLTKYVERLAGQVTCDGCECTHVVTGEVRRTLNFCVAISSGSWILSPEWLKTSVKQKSFADETRFILRDRKFESKYKVSLQDVIRRAQQRPNLLLDGMHIFPTPNVHPPVATICQIVEAAGGKILRSIQDVVQLENKSHAAAVACEEDMSLALTAAKAGLRTFSSDWLLTCIVKQELDLTANEFTESL